MNKVSTRSAIFYLLTAIMLLLLVTKTQKQFLPEGIATQLGHNSESFLFALLVAAQIQILRRAAPSSARLAAMALVAGVLIGLGMLLANADVAPTVVTLNEPLIGAGFVLLYQALPRSVTTAAVVTAVVVLYVVIAFNTDFVLDQAESLVPLALAGPALDIFDRTILRPELADEPGLRLAWMGFLLVVVIALIPAAHWAREDLHGSLRLGIDYAQRAAEAYWGWLLIHVFFSYWLGSLWRSPAHASVRPVRQSAGG